MHASNAVLVGLRSGEYYLNCIKNADRVTRHGDLLLGGGTAIGIRKERTRLEALLLLQFSVPGLLGLLCVHDCKI